MEPEQRQGELESMEVRSEYHSVACCKSRTTCRCIHHVSELKLHMSFFPGPAALPNCRSGLSLIGRSSRPLGLSSCPPGGLVPREATVIYRWYRQWRQESQKSTRPIHLLKQPTADLEQFSKRKRWDRNQEI